MKTVEIHVINEREFDLNSYKPNAYQKANSLLEQYGNLLKEINNYKEESMNSIGHWALNEPEALDKHYKKMNHLLTQLEDIESQLISLDNDFNNHKGIPWRKICHLLLKFLISDWFPFILGFVAAYILIDELINKGTLREIGVSLFFMLVLFYQSRNIFKKIKDKF